MSRTILLADDSVTIQKVIELTFMEEDYEVVAAGDGDEALERLDELRPDFVIADVHMPGASGIDVCRRAKQLYPEVPVLLLVGTFEPFDEGEARAAGADAHLKKPFDSQELLQLVDDLMGPEEAAAQASATVASAVAEPEDSDSTWGFDVAGETPKASAEPEWAVPVEEPEADWAASPSPVVPEPEPEWAVPAPEEPEWAASGPSAGGSEPEEPTGDAEWGPLDPQPAEVTPPAVGQVEVAEPVWDRPYPGEEEPAPAAREPFHLGDVEPRNRGHEEVFDLGAGEDETAVAGAGAAGSYGAHPGWGFDDEGEAAGGAAGSAGAAGEPAPDEGGDADREIAAAGFRWDETGEPGSLVTPPDEPYPAVAGEPSWGEPEETVPEETPPEAAEAEPTEPETVEPEAAAAAPTWKEPAAAAEPAWEEQASASEPAWEEPAAAAEPAWEEPEAVFEPVAAEPESAEPYPAAEPLPGSGASYGGAEVSAPPAVIAAPPGGLSEDDVERIARRVAELVGERVTRDVAWEVVPDLAEVVIRERLRELEGQID